MSDATMSAVTLCDPSMTDGAIKLRVIKTLLRKFRGKIFANSAVVHLFGRLSQKKLCSAASFGVSRLSGFNISSPSIKSKKWTMHLTRGRTVHTTVEVSMSRNKYKRLGLLNRGDITDFNTGADLRQCARARG